MNSVFSRLKIPLSIGRLVASNARELSFESLAISLQNFLSLNCTYKNENEEKEATKESEQKSSLIIGHLLI